jgi:hypothetical protein
MAAFSLAAVHFTKLNFSKRHKADAQEFAVSGRKRSNSDPHDLAQLLVWRALCPNALAYNDT